jgi:hypothetical protein
MNIENTNTTQNPNNCTGPITEAGKFESSKNALKHGLTSESIDRFPVDIQDAYRSFLHNLYIELNPQSICEEDYLQQYAFNRFQLQRAQPMLTKALADFNADPTNEVLEKRYVRFTRHVRALERSAANALKEFRNFVSDRIAAAELDSHLPDDLPQAFSFPVAFPSHRLLQSKDMRRPAPELALRFAKDLLSRYGGMLKPNAEADAQAK